MYVCLYIIYIEMRTLSINGAFSSHGADDIEYLQLWPLTSYKSVTICYNPISFTE